MSSLELKPDALHVLVSSASYIFEQAAFHNMKAEKLKDHLKTTGIDDDKVNFFFLVTPPSLSFYLSSSLGVLKYSFFKNIISWRLSGLFGRHLEAHCLQI